MKMKKILLTVVGILFSLLCFAQTKEQALSAVLKANASYSTVISPFKQVKTLKGLKKDDVREGTLYFSPKTSQLNMQYSKPAGNQLLINGDKLVVINGGTRTVYNAKTNQMMKTLKGTLLCCVAGKVEEAATLNKATIEYKDSDKYYVFVLTVDKPVLGGLSKVELSYSKKDGSLCLMKLTDKNSVTVYETPTKEFNKPLDEGIFNN